MEIRMSLLSQTNHEDATRKSLRNIFLYLVQVLSMSSIIFNIYLRVFQLVHGIFLLSLLCFLIGMLIGNVRSILYVTLFSAPAAIILVFLFIGSPAMIGMIKNGESFWLMLTFSMKRISVISMTCFIVMVPSSLMSYIISGKSR